MPAIWITWALGDITGALIIAPLLILWTADHRSLALRGRPLEALALLLSVVGITLVVFGGLAPAAWRQYPLAFLAIPPLLWAAVRFGRREAAIVVVVLMAIAVRGTMRGFGAFAALPPTHSLLVLQSFVATMALMTLIVAALARSRERERILLQAIIDRIPVMITMYDAEARVLRLNREFERITGWSTAAARDVDLMERCYPDPAYRAEARAYMDSMREGWRDFALTTRDGRVLKTSWSNIRLPDDTRIGIGLDVTERRRSEEDRERARAEAEEASRIKDEFFAMLGHELRNPLGAITTALVRDRHRRAGRRAERAGPGDHRASGAPPRPARGRPARRDPAHHRQGHARPARGGPGRGRAARGGRAGRRHADAAPAVRGGRIGVDRGRRDPARADPHQPPRQRREVHAGGWPGDRRHRGPRRRGGALRGGHGRRASPPISCPGSSTCSCRATPASTGRRPGSASASPW